MYEGKKASFFYCGTYVRRELLSIRVLVTSVIRLLVHFRIMGFGSGVGESFGFDFDLSPFTFVLEVSLVHHSTHLSSLFHVSGNIWVAFDQSFGS